MHSKWEKFNLTTLYCRLTVGKLAKIAVCILLKSFGEITPFIVRLDLLKDKTGKETIFKISRLYKYHVN